MSLYHTLNSEGRTILAALEDSRIVDFCVHDGTVVVTEMCDGYFSRTLTRAHFAQLIVELQALQETLE